MEFCPNCGKPHVSARYDVDKFQYLDQGILINLQAAVKVFTCLSCDFQYTDFTAEEARDAVVKWHVKNRTKHTGESDCPCHSCYSGGTRS